MGKHVLGEFPSGGWRTGGMVGEPLNATAAYARQLRILHEEAGRPTAAAIHRQAQVQRPPLKVPSSTWSNWLNGKSVPSDETTARWLVEDYLLPRAKQRSPEFAAPPPWWWEKTRRAARAERSKGGRPPLRWPPTTTAEPEAVVQVGRIPQAAACFQKREIADQIVQFAAEGGTVVLGQVLTGMGGVGKTQLAAAYARHAREKDVKVLVWATASSRSTIIDAYADAAAKLGLTGREAPDRAAQEFLVWADTTTTPWLVVLDDLQNPKDLRDLWPPQTPAGTTLVTTRRRDASLFGGGRCLVNVGLFSADEARSYLRAKLGDLAGDDERLDSLAENLGWLPLALAQAAAFMADQQVDCARYQELLSRRLLAHSVPEPEGLPDEHHHIVAAAWELTIEQADQARPAGLARLLLRLTSVLDPNGIPSSVLMSEPARTYLANGQRSVTARTTLEDSGSINSEMIDEALRVLHRFSLVDHDRNAVHREVRVHQLVQRSAREAPINNQTDPIHGTDPRTALVGVAANALLSAWPEVEGDLGPILRANTAALRRVGGDALWSWNGALHPLLFRAITSLGESGQAAAAHREYTAVLDRATRTLGSDHGDTFTVRHHVARWRGIAGDAPGAIAVFTDLLTDQLQVLGPDHPDTLNTRNRLAWWLGEAGNPAGAAAALEELLTDQLRALGPAHLDTLKTRSHLAWWLGEAGDPTGAAVATEAVLADFLRLFGSDHLDTLNTRYHLAHWRSRAGDPTGSAAVFRDLIADRLRLFGPDHPHTFTARRGLASAQGEAGDPESAVTALEELLTDQLRVLGADHPHTHRTRRQLEWWREKVDDKRK